MNIYKSNNRKIKDMGYFKVFDGLIFPSDEISDNILKLSGFEVVDNLSKLTYIITKYTNNKKFIDFIKDKDYNEIFSKYMPLVYVYLRAIPDNESFIDYIKNKFQTDVDFSHSIIRDTLPSITTDRFIERDNSFMGLPLSQGASIKVPQYAYEYLVSKSTFGYKDIDTSVLTDTIAKSPLFSYEYSIYTRKRFIKGEDIIATDAYYAFAYAKRFGFRFFQAEDTIRKSDDIWHEYIKYFEIEDLFEE